MTVLEVVRLANLRIFVSGTFTRASPLGKLEEARKPDVRELTVRPSVPDELLHPPNGRRRRKGHGSPAPGDEKKGKRDLRRLRNGILARTCLLLVHVPIIHVHVVCEIRSRGVRAGASREVDASV